MDFSYPNESFDQRLNKNLMNEQRRTVFKTLLELSHDEKLKRGSITSVAAEFAVSVKTAHRTCQIERSCIIGGLPADVSSRMSKTVGRKRVQIDIRKIVELPFRFRTNIRRMSCVLCVTKSILYRRIKKGMLRPYTNSLKPLLSE